MAIGDALAVALLQEKGFRREDFARLHPGGSLGKQLLTRVADVMVGDDLPLAATDRSWRGPRSRSRDETRDRHGRRRKRRSRSAS